MKRTDQSRKSQSKLTIIAGEQKVYEGVPTAPVSLETEKNVYFAELTPDGEIAFGKKQEVTKERTGPKTYVFDAARM